MLTSFLVLLFLVELLASRGQLFLWMEAVLRNQEISWQVLPLGRRQLVNQLERCLRFSSLRKRWSSSRMAAQSSRFRMALPMVWLSDRKDCSVYQASASPLAQLLSRYFIFSTTPGSLSGRKGMPTTTRHLHSFPAKLMPSENRPFMMMKRKAVPDSTSAEYCLKIQSTLPPLVSKKTFLLMIDANFNVFSRRSQLLKATMTPPFTKSSIFRRSLQISSNCLYDCLPWKLKLKGIPFSLLGLSCAQRWWAVMKLSVVILCGKETCRFLSQMSRLPSVPEESRMARGLQSSRRLKQSEGSRQRNSSSPFTRFTVNLRNSSKLAAVAQIFSSTSTTICVLSQPCSFLWNTLMTFLALTTNPLQFPRSRPSVLLVEVICSMLSTKFSLLTNWVSAALLIPPSNSSKTSLTVSTSLHSSWGSLNWRCRYFLLCSLMSCLSSERASARVSAVRRTSEPCSQRESMLWASSKMTTASLRSMEFFSNRFQSSRQLKGRTVISQRSVSCLAQKQGQTSSFLQKSRNSCSSMGLGMRLKENSLKVQRRCEHSSSQAFSSCLPLSCARLWLRQAWSREAMTLRLQSQTVRRNSLTTWLIWECVRVRQYTFFLPSASISADSEPTSRHTVFPVPVGLSMRAFCLLLTACWMALTTVTCCGQGGKGKKTLLSWGTKWQLSAFLRLTCTSSLAAALFSFFIDSLQQSKFSHNSGGQEEQYSYSI